MVFKISTITRELETYEELVKTLQEIARDTARAGYATSQKRFEPISASLFDAKHLQSCDITAQGLNESIHGLQ